MDKKPNFFVVGAAKSGTTTLSNWLDSHPEVYISPIKEPNFFSTDIDISLFEPFYKKNTFFADTAYFSNRPLKKVHLSFIRSNENYNALFEDVLEEKAIGECSTSYLYSELAAENIKKYQPDAKIIIILRNPVSRAFSHYLMALRFGYTSKKFLEEIEIDRKRLNKGWGISRLYIELGMYSEQIKRYYNHFAPDKILILLNEELNNNTLQTFNKVCDFLNVSKINHIQLNRYNEANIPKMPVFNRLVSRSGLKFIVQKLVSDKFKDQVLKLLFSKSDVPVISKSEKEFLLKIYKPDIISTSEIIGRDLNHWLK